MTRPTNFEPLTRPTDFEPLTQPTYIELLTRPTELQEQNGKAHVPDDPDQDPSLSDSSSKKKT